MEHRRGLFRKDNIKEEKKKKHEDMVSKHESIGKGKEIV